MLFRSSSGGAEWMIVFLGNAGPRYNGTRHNVGFVAIDYLAHTLGVKITKLKFRGAYGEAFINGKKCILLKPHTYMNSSGESVREAAEFFKIEPKNIIVMYDDIVVVSPDFGSVTRARNFAQKLNVPIAIIDKRRPKPNVSEVMNIIGEVKGKRVILVDDMIDTAGTIVHGAQALLDRGAKEIYACCTHPVLSGPAIERLEASPIKELVCLNTIELPPEKIMKKTKVISVAPIFAEAIERIYEDISVSPLFV